jgi:hypothetical protein
MAVVASMSCGILAFTRLPVTTGIETAEDRIRRGSDPGK